MQINIALVAWIALGLIWGSNFIFMKWATEYISPSQLVFVRVALGFVPVFIYAALKRQLRFVHLRHSAHFVAMAFLAAVVYYYGFAKGTSLLPSGIAGAVSGAIPLFSLIAAALVLPEERINRAKLIGLMVGFVGVVTIARPFDSGGVGTSFEGVMYLVFGSLSLGVSFVYTRKFISPLGLRAAALTTYQLGFATLILAFTTNFDGIEAIAKNSAALWGSIVGLGLIGTGLAYIIYYYIVAHMGAVRAASVTYLPPIVALFIGAVLAHEAIGPLDYFATGLIFVGVLLVSRKDRMSDSRARQRRRNQPRE